MPPLTREEQVLWLLGSAVLSLLLWQFRWGPFVLYPFALFATWCHEMGHGLTAVFLGGKFVEMRLMPNGSGYAVHAMRIDASPLRQAMVVIGGPLGPACVAAVCLVNSRSSLGARITLALLAVMLLLTGLGLVKTFFGGFVTLGWGAVLAAVAYFADSRLEMLILQLLCVQGAISTFRQVDYLFARSTKFGRKRVKSDTEALADLLGGPYWLWGTMLAAASLGLLACGLWAAFG